MSKSILFRTRAYTYSNIKYETIMKGLVRRCLYKDTKHNVYISKATESVYVISTIPNKDGYVLFTIKSHKEFRPSSVRVFNTRNYLSMEELEWEIKKYLKGVVDGKNPTYRFKYGSYYTLRKYSEMSNNRSTLYRTNLDNYTGTLNGVINRTDGVELDSTTHSRIKSLIFQGLIKGYAVDDNTVELYITQIGVFLLDEGKDKYDAQYRKETGE